MLTFLRRKTEFRPLPLGPEYDRAGSTVTVRTGPLAGRRFGLEAAVTQIKADFTLTPVPESSIAGHCHFDRDPETGLETLWDIVIHPDFRRQGLAALLVRSSFRDLLSSGRQTWFGMRKLMQVDTRKPELHNIGIGLLAVRLGFLPAPDLDHALAHGQVRAVSILPATPSSPPGLMIHLNRLPGVIVAAELEPAASNPDCPVPVSDPDRYHRFLSAGELLRRARQGAWLIGNVDYLLARENLELLGRHLATTPDEFRQFTRSLAAGAKKLGLKHGTALHN